MHLSRLLPAALALLVACNDSPTSNNEASQFDGEWLALNSGFEYVRLNVSSRGDSLLGTLTLSGRMIQLGGLRSTDGLLLQDLQDSRWTLSGMPLDGFTMEVRAGSGPNRFDLLMRRSKLP
jgi:hypothetical protein